MDADTVAFIIAYEHGVLSEAEEHALFQRLIDSGDVWKLQGHYGRQAAHFIDIGRCTMPEVLTSCDPDPET